MHKTLGDALLAAGYRRTVWVSFADITKHEFGAFNPGAKLLDFAGRYGSAKRKGDLVGERYARFIVEDVIRHPSNPLEIEGNAGYILRDGEEYDAKMLTTGADLAAYDSFFRPRYKALFPETSPAPKPTPVPTPRPVPQPTPQPPGRSTEAQRVEELRSMLLTAIDESFKVRPGSPNADIVKALYDFAGSAFMRLALLRAVQLWRKAFPSS